MSLAYGIGGLVSVPPAPIRGSGPPPASFRGQLGQQFFDETTDPPTQYIYNGQTWESGGNAYATTTTPGIVQLSDDVTADQASETLVPTAKATFDYGQSLVLAGANVATEVVQGIGTLATDAQAVARTPNNPGVTALFLTPTNLDPILASPSAIGSTTPAAGTFTDLTATGTISISSAAPVTIDVTGAGNDLTLSSDAGRVIINGEEAAANAVTLLSAAGGIDADAALQINIASSQNAVDAIRIVASAGGIDIDAVGAATEDINITNTGGSVVIVATENVADAIVLNASAGGIDILAAGAATEDIDITNTAGSVHISAGEAVADALTLDASAGGLTATCVGQLTITTSQNAADAMVLTSSAGGIDILATGAATEDIDIINTGGSVNITATENAAEAIYIRTNGGVTETLRLHADQGTGAASINIGSDVGGVTVTGGLATGDAINIVASNAAGGIDIDAGTGGFIVDTTGGISLDSAAASNFTATGAFDITIQSTAGSILLNAGEAAADAINIDSTGGFDLDAALQINIDSSQAAAANSIRLNASAVDGGIDVDAGTGGITIDTTGALSLDSAAASNFTVTGAFDLTLASTVGSINITAGEDAADAIVLTASAGGIDILATGAAGQDIDISNTGGSVNITATESAADSIVITSTTGGIDILASGAAAGEDIDIIATGSSVNISATESAADSITIISTAGGIDISASGAAAGEDIDITATGSSINITATESVSDAIVINASGAASGLTLDCGTASVSIGSGLKMAVTSVATAASPYAVLGTDYFISTDTTGGALTITLPAVPGTGRTVVVYDGTGQAAIGGNITIDGNGNNIAAAGTSAATKLINTAYESYILTFNGTIWCGQNIV